MQRRLTGTGRGNSRHAVESVDGLIAHTAKQYHGYKVLALLVIRYPGIAAVIWAAAGMGSTLGFSAGLFAYVCAMIHWSTAKSWNWEFFSDMKSKRSPKMVGLFEKYHDIFRTLPIGK